MKGIEYKGQNIIKEIKEIRNSIENFYDLLKNDTSFKGGIKKAVNIILSNCFNDFSKKINDKMETSLNEAVSNFEKSSNISGEVRNIVRKSILGEEFPISLIADIENKMLEFIKNKINENINNSLSEFKDNLDQSFESLHVLRRGINKKSNSTKGFRQFKNNSITREEIREQFGSVISNLSNSLSNLEKAFNDINNNMITFDDNTLNEMGNIFINNVQVQIQILQKDLQYNIVSKTIDIDEALKNNMESIKAIQKLIRNDIKIDISNDIVDKLNREMSILMDFSSSKILSSIKEKLMVSFDNIEQYINVSMTEYTSFYGSTLNYIIEKIKKDIYIFEKCIVGTEGINKVLKHYAGIKMGEKIKTCIYGNNLGIIEKIKNLSYIEIVDLEELSIPDFIIYVIENYEEDFKKEEILKIYDNIKENLNKMNVVEFIWFFKEEDQYDKVKNEIKKLNIQKSHVIFFTPEAIESTHSLDANYITALCFKKKIKKYLEDISFYEDSISKVANMDIFTEEKLEDKLFLPSEKVINSLEDLSQNPGIDYKRLKREIKKSLEFKKLRNIVNDENTNGSLRKVFKMWLEDAESVIDEIARNADCGNKFFFDESKFKINVKYILSDFRNDLEVNDEWQIIFCFIKSAIFLNAFYSKNLSTYYTEDIRNVSLEAIKEDFKQIEYFIENY